MCDLSQSPEGFPGVVKIERFEVDPNFEPQTRARSNTWPLPRPDDFIDQDGEDKPAVVPVHLHGQIGPDLTGTVAKKNSSRRNAWGNMSYAELISQAIQSSPEQRLTLAQIYEWMVQNVPYFKDKGDSNSSAGWKNSIRHNLSLHNRFMRVQNEGTGKSSWWMVNPDAKPGKAARRRATSMETQKYEKKRGRVRKKVEALRNGQTAATPSPSSSISEGHDMFPESPVHHGFQLSPDFRPRASSNASSCGRLSPIPAVDSDMHDSEVPPLSPLPWNQELVQMYPQPPSPNHGSNHSLDRYTDHLVESLAGSMKLRNNGTNGDGYSLPDCALKPLPNGRTNQVSTGGYTISYKPQYGSSGGVSRVTNGDYTRMQPPPYQQHNSLVDTSCGGGCGGGALSNGSSLPSMSPNIGHKRSSPPNSLEPGLNGSSYTLTRLQTIGSNGNSQSISPSPESLIESNPFAPGQRSHMRFAETVLRNPMAYKEIKDPTLPLLQQHLQGVHQTAPPDYHRMSTTSASATSLTSTANHIHSLYNTLPQDLDFENVQGGLECDVEKVILHELNVEGNLDFNFDPMNVAANGGSVPHSMSMTTPRSWVH